MALRASQPPPYAREPRLVAGRYRIIAELGRGGMGVVYRVRDSTTGHDLALKQLVAGGRPADAQAAVSLFEREFYVLAQLAHPRVISVHDYGHDAVGPFYTMELLEGADLRSLAPLPVERACALLIDVCSSLALLHARRLVHRDISPRNIRCTRDGHAKLIDFGAMTPMGPCTHAVGTPAFIAPEVVNHSELDARADLFSLGATLYYALTGCSPFPARELSELRQLWSAELVLPSRLVPAIPPALDALCAALLRVDPAQRPGSAFEVMQRLQAIAGIQLTEHEAAQRAFLSTPALVGRDDILRRFRQAMRRGLHGQGAGWLLESEGGLGRSRVLDACVLEAKTLGAVVLRAAASTSEKSSLAVAQHLAEQLVRSAPDAAQAAAAQRDLRSLLFEADSKRLRALADASLDRSTIQSALSTWITTLCDTHALLIVVDDVHEIDEASIALLAALALEAKDLRLVILVSSEQTGGAGASAALSVLAQHCTLERLRSLDHDETAALVAGVFGNVPNVQLLADRLFALAAGNPRETLVLAQHLVDTGVVHYDHGRWTLPSELEASALPSSAAEAFEARVRVLPALARRLAESQALVGHVLRREDYAALAPDADPAALHGAVLLLLECQILRSDGEFYSLSHRALSDVLRGLIDPAQRRERHLALYELYRKRPDANLYLLMRHLLEAEQYELAFAPFSNPELISEAVANDAIARAGIEDLIRTFETALELALRLHRPARQIHGLRRLLCGLATRGDESVYARVSPDWLARLEIDSGLADYRTQDPALAPATRLQNALTTAAARYATTAERDRVYNVDEAIRNLGAYVLCSIVAGARAQDTLLLAKLPGLLEPFVSLSAVLFALWQNALATHERFAGMALRARRRWCDVFERLAAIPPQSLAHVTGIRWAAARAIAEIDVAIGSATALDWVAHLDSEPLQRMDALYFRRLGCLTYGDSEGAERLQKQGELLSLRLSARPYFNPRWVTELLAGSASRDLAAIKRVIDAITPLAARHIAWKAHLLIARGEFELVRGDPAAAQIAFHQALSLTRPDNQSDPILIEPWANATAGLMSASLERAKPEEARALGDHALTVCERRGFELWWFRIAQRMALAETQLGQVQGAVTRIEQLIATQRELRVRGLFLAQSYVIRTQIAIAAGDAAAATHYAALVLAEPGGDKLLSQAAQREPWLAEARRAGVDLALAPTAFEVSVFGTNRSATWSPEAERLRGALAACSSAEQRAARALELLCELADGASGYLYLVAADRALNLAAKRHAKEPDAFSVQFARGFFAQQIDDEGLSLGLTRATYMLSLPGAAFYKDPRGSESQLFMLTTKQRGSLAYVGLGVLQANPSAEPAAQLASLLAVLAEALLRAGDSPGVRACDVQPG
jgi:hypothetical protein